MSDGIIVLMLVLAVICVMLATQPAPPPRSRRSRSPDQVEPRRPATKADGANASSADDDPHDHRFTALHASSGPLAAAHGSDGLRRSSAGHSTDSASAALALWPTNGNTLR
ncbi:MAG TPA: hypothetical protein VFL82_07565 [Thermomicrobiales bacterium]|nr:hypothetical protein [Thermomicrobiales bacterium]